MAGGVSAVMVMVQVLVAELEAASTTLEVYVNDPAALGIPVIAPVDEFNARLVGRLPELIEKVYGGVPPLAASAEVKGCPTCPPPEVQADVGANAAAEMVIEQLLVAV